MKKQIKEPYGFVYITTNIINGIRYIGQKIFDNWYGWKNYLGSGIEIKKAIKKYGKENFTRDIVAIAYSREELDDLEIKWIKNYNAVESKDFYNIAQGGNGGILREYKYSKDNPNSISVFCITTKENFDCIRDASEKYDVDASNLVSCCKGKYKSAGKLKDGTKLVWMYYDEYLKLSIESIETNLDNIKVDKKSGIRDKHKIENIYCIETRKIFESIPKANEYYNIKRQSSIYDVLNGKQKTAGFILDKYENKVKLHWTYYNDYLEIK